MAGDVDSTTCAELVSWRVWNDHSVICRRERGAVLLSSVSCTSRVGRAMTETRDHADPAIAAVSTTDQSPTDYTAAPVGEEIAPAGPPGGRRYGADLIVDALRAHGIEYVAVNPGPSFRGLHDSLITDPPGLYANSPPFNGLSSRPAPAIGCRWRRTKSSAATVLTDLICRPYSVVTVWLFSGMWARRRRSQRHGMTD